MKKFWNFIISIFVFRCSECGGKVKEEPYDVRNDMEIYRCTRCGKEYHVH